MENPSPRLTELWLTLVHGALCRQVAGGLLAKTPANVDLMVARGAVDDPASPSPQKLEPFVINQDISSFNRS